MRFVLDASVALTFMLPDEKDDFSLRVLDACRDATIVVPSIWRAEVLNGLLGAQRRKRVGADGVEIAIALIDALDAEVDERPVDMIATYRLAVRHKLTVYDTLYLDLAARHGVGLATHDAELKRAARAANVMLLT